MPNKMLIDASHPEETRVVVVRGNRIEEFDFESEHKKQIKGNIYLAKVTRVEPSLQAAFVEYGGNRHGFLAFSEIHPDYYQIPVADRQALVEDEMARVREEEEDEERKITAQRRNPRRPGGGKSIRAAESSGDDSIFEPIAAEGGEPGDEETDGAPSLSENEHEAPELMGDDAGGDELLGDESEDETSGEEADAEGRPARSASGRGRRSRSRRGHGAEDAPGGDDEEEVVDEMGAEDAMEEVPVRVPRAPRKQYKIQEVIKRRQILLVQVVKEERGNKGAALTTYLSLAGRYSVLMPNTARGGGISRKITNIADRKRLKEVARELEVPKGMGIILRTAGAMRTKAEVKRDYEYLMRLWETVRSLTLASAAPTLVYEEGSLIKRSIRDLYNKDIDQICVSGEEGYREAKDFMRMLMPSQSKVVQAYRDPVPIFARGGIEAQLDRMLQPHVTLKSGGYIIINQTEALVAIDVNSGRSTREHSIEDTAYQTNLEAAEEVARQLRLRDLAGLIVIDFIDMEEKRNNRAVEKKMKDCLKDDRARIQIGHISHFGLMEMSRQRIRASVLESTTRVCPTCDGVGHIRSNSSLALHVVRAIEEHVQKHSTHDVIVKVPTATALYVLNEKRQTIEDLERANGLRITIEADDSHGHQHVAIEQGPEAVRREYLPAVAPVVYEDEPEDLDLVEDVEETEETGSATAVVDAPAGDADTEEKTDDQPRRKRRRRRRRGGSDASDDGQDAGDAGEDDGGDDASGDDTVATDDEGDAEETAATQVTSDDESSEEERARKRRRRGRRGGRKNRDGETEGVSAGADDRTEGENGEAVTSGEDGPLEAGALPLPETAEEVGAAEVAELPFEASPEPVRNPWDSAPATEAEHEQPTAEPTAVAEVAPVSDEPAGAEVAPVAAVLEPVTEAPALLEAETAAGETRVTDEAAAPVEEAAAPAEPAVRSEPAVTSSRGSEQAEPGAKRTGWWARRSFF
ncbi:ribonuclease E [Aureimonas sp. SA4125]|uniref:ribonuclease E/G n=1 Tax=Aureimonas sp. SA4125 TaxID=2826993 RepID=UPI001CC64920|nr:ribonuclease E/G [Aureimonas sp. SA4125]BDA84505.1 ribonuclease E [Aureimonas sp. SA4125]